MIEQLKNQASTVGPGQIGHIMEQMRVMEGMMNQFVLTDAEEEERQILLNEGFADWTRKDFRAFCNAVEAHGRYEINKIIEDVTNNTVKDAEEIKKYYVSFWLNYQRIPDYQKIIEKIEKGEKKIIRLRVIRELIQQKVELHLESVYSQMYPGVEEGKVSKQLLEKHSPWDLLMYSWSHMKFNYGQGQRGQFSYGETEDGFLIAMMHRHGYGAARRIQLEIRRAWQFRFNWYFKSRSPQEIQKRCDVLIRVIEKEIQEWREKEELKRRQAEARRAMMIASNPRTHPPAYSVPFAPTVSTTSIPVQPVPFHVPIPVAPAPAMAQHPPVAPPIVHQAGQDDAKLNK